MQKKQSTGPLPLLPDPGPLPLPGPLPGPVFALPPAPPWPLEPPPSPLLEPPSPLPPSP